MRASRKKNNCISSVVLLPFKHQQQTRLLFVSLAIWLIQIASTWMGRLMDRCRMLKLCGVLKSNTLKEKNSVLLHSVKINKFSRKINFLKLPATPLPPLFSYTLPTPLFHIPLYFYFIIIEFIMNRYMNHRPDPSLQPGVAKNFDFWIKYTLWYHPNENG